MKKTVVVALACVALCACGQRSDKAEQTAAKEQGREVVVKRKRIAVARDFNYITNIGTTDIVFTHGDYSVEAEGDSVMLDMVKTDFDSNLLTVSLGVDGNPDYGASHKPSGVKLYVSAPSLRCVTLCNTGGFTCTDDWVSDEIQIGLYGTGRVSLGNVECGKLLIESSAGGSVDIGHLKAEVATLNSRSDGTFTIDCDVNDFVITNSGSQAITLTGTIASKSIYNPRDPKLSDSTK